MKTYKNESLAVGDIIVRRHPKTAQRLYRGVISIQDTTTWLTTEVADTKNVELTDRDRLFTENEIQTLKYELVAKEKPNG